MKNNYEKHIEELNIEIFELEQKVKDLTKYKNLYFFQQKEIKMIKEALKNNFELLPDQVKFNFKNLLEELFGIKYN